MFRSRVLRYDCVLVNGILVGVWLEDELFLELCWHKGQAANYDIAFCLLTVFDRWWKAWQPMGWILLSWPFLGSFWRDTRSARKWRARRRSSISSASAHSSRQAAKDYGRRGGEGWGGGECGWYLNPFGTLEGNNVKNIWKKKLMVKASSTRSSASYVSYLGRGCSRSARYHVRSFSIFGQE